MIENGRIGDAADLVETFAEKASEKILAELGGRAPGSVRGLLR